MQVPNENASSNTYLESNLTNSGNGNLFELTKYKTGDSQRLWLSQKILLWLKVIFLV